MLQGGYKYSNCELLSTWHQLIVVLSLALCYLELCLPICLLGVAYLEPVGTYDKLISNDTLSKFDNIYILLQFLFILILWCSPYMVICTPGHCLFISVPILPGHAPCTCVTTTSSAPRILRPRRGTTDTNCSVFGLMRSGIKLGTWRRAGGHYKFACINGAKSTIIIVFVTTIDGQWIRANVLDNRRSQIQSTLFLIHAKPRKLVLRPRFSAPHSVAHNYWAPWNDRGTSIRHILRAHFFFVALNHLMLHVFCLV